MKAFIGKWLFKIRWFFKSKKEKEMTKKVAFEILSLLIANGGKLTFTEEQLANQIDMKKINKEG